MFDGKLTREIDASLAVQPLVHSVPMPGFFRIIQSFLSMLTPHYIHLRFYAVQERSFGDKPVREHLYRSWEIDAAIDAFLQNASPSDQVQFSL